MNKTIVITGASSGIGKATAQLFHAKGWNVAATMRNPQAEKDLKPGDRLFLCRLDVQDQPSIGQAVQTILDRYGRIDVWLNNAGYGAFGPLEAGSDQEIRRQYDVNFFGVIDCIKAILPHFKANKAGLIVNISSIGGLLTLPLFGLYNSSKWALEGLSEGLWYDLQPLGIGVKVVEPGAIKTDFAGRSLDVFDLTGFPEYKQYHAVINDRITNPKYSKNFSSPDMVARVVYNACTDGSKRLRYLAGSDAKQFWTLRRWLGAPLQMSMVKRYFKL
jgi:NAD(P)-dependent dehydrogenase (short-subunit alcohol dehydrogenase family)